MTLIIFTISIFLILGTIGFCYYNNKAWDFIDSIYYPVAALGIVILFMQDSSYRDILDKQNEINNLEKKIFLIHGTKPIIEDYFNEKDLIPIVGKNFSQISELADICIKGNIYNPLCTVAKDMSKTTSKYEYYFFENNESNNIENLCNMSYKLINDLNQSKMPKLILNKLKEFYTDSLNVGYTIFQYEEQNNKINSFKKITELEIIELMNTLDNTDLKYTKQLKETYLKYLDYAYVILNSFKICARAPENIRNGNLREWNTTYTSLLNEKVNIKNDISKLKTKDIIKNFWFRYLIWPFIIIFALSLKFGKSISSLRRNFVKTRKIK